MSEQRTKSVFPPLEKQFSGEWKFNFHSTAFAQDLRIVVEPEDDLDAENPSERQARAFAWFQENQESFRRLVEESAYGFYQERRSEMHAAFGPEGDIHCPMLRSSSEIWGLVGKPEVCFLGEYADIYVHLDATWDPEHGITLLLEGGQVKKIE